MGLLGGICIAAAAGILCEAVVIALYELNDASILARSARFVRILEVGFATVVVALSIGILPRRIFSRWLRRPSTTGACVAAAGILLPFWIGLAFLFNPPAEQAIRLSKDPLLLRLPMIAAASLVYLLAFLPVRRFVEAAYGLSFAGVWIAGSALAVGAALWPGAPEDIRPLSPDIFLITVDTLRADHLGCYGYSLPTSPAIDRFCEDSIVFERAMASVPETIPAYVSLMTGFLPSEHRVYTNMMKASDELSMLPERLRDTGYVTAAVLDGSFPGTFANLDQGFDLIVQSGVVAWSPIYTLRDALDSIVHPAISVLDNRLLRDHSVTTHIARRWIRDLATDRPLFLHVYWPFPHASYDPPRSYIERIPRGAEPIDVAERIRRYDGEVRFTDEQVRLVLDAIDRRPGSERAWTIFTADHGEELGRHLPEFPEPFFGHSYVLYDSSVHIPLIVRPPAEKGLRPRRDPAVVSAASLAATILEIAGDQPSRQMLPALSLSPRGEAGSTSFSIMREPSRLAKRGKIDWVSARRDGWRLIEKRAPEYAMELLRYDSKGESRASVREHPEIVGAILDELRAQFPPDQDDVEDEAEQLTSAEEELLRELGYIH